ncbi:MAG: mandelate racemase/muconate lactonizing enzyme family protein, partial [Phycisphaeraceae bacterium]
MRITEIQCLAFTIPGHPYVVGQEDAPDAPTATRYRNHPHYRAIYSPHAESMLVRIVTDAGVEGFGEAQACIMPETVTHLIDELLAPVLMGADPRQPAVLRDRMYDLMRERGHDAGFLPDAIAACDMALWDLTARAADVPLYQLLGGAYRNEIPCYVSGVPAADVDQQLDRIAEWIEKGFTRFKLSYAPTIEDHVKHLRAIRERFGETVQVMIDAHWAFTVRQATDLGRALEPFNVYWIECPLLPENAANQAVLAPRLATAHALGEEYRTRYHFLDRLSRHAIDIAQPDVGRTGITEARRIAALCLA